MVNHAGLNTRVYSFTECTASCLLLRRVSSSGDFFLIYMLIFFLLKVKVYLFHTYSYFTLYVILAKTTHDNYTYTPYVIC